jgi:hypothetical protein
MQLSIDKMMEASVIINDGLSRIHESSSKSPDLKLKTLLFDSISRVEESLVRLLEKAKHVGLNEEESALDNQYDQLIFSVDTLMENMDTSEGIVTSTKALTLSATQYVNTLKKVAAESQIDDERKNLLKSAKLLAEVSYIS